MIHSKEELSTSFYKLGRTERQILFGWIRTNLTPADEPLWSYSSYALKHCFSSSTGIYVENNGFKFAMLQCGYEPIDETEENHHYHIGKDSIGLKFRCV